MKTVEQCSQYDTCKAPICPLDTNSVANSLWYPGEQVCVMRGAPSWVKTQRKITKRQPDTTRYFKVADLMAIKVVRKPVGRNPDEMAWEKTRKTHTRQNQLPLLTSG